MKSKKAANGRAACAAKGKVIRQSNKEQSIACKRNTRQLPDLIPQQWSENGRGMVVEC